MRALEDFIDYCHHERFQYMSNITVKHTEETARIFLF
jgi:hypothetical protein